MFIVGHCADPSVTCKFLSMPFRDMSRPLSLSLPLPQRSNTFQESLLLLAFERFQQSQQRQRLASLALGALVISGKSMEKDYGFTFLRPDL